MPKVKNSLKILQQIKTLKIVQFYTSFFSSGDTNSNLVPQIFTPKSDEKMINMTFEWVAVEK